MISHFGKKARLLFLSRSIEAERSERYGVEKSEKRGAWTGCDQRQNVKGAVKRLALRHHRESQHRANESLRIARETGYDLSQAARGFRQLAAYGYLEVIEERTGGKRRGGVERVYRKTMRAHFNSPSWAALPLILREDITGNTVSSYLDRIQEAMEAETLDAETDRHLTWDSAPLDRQAWTELMTHLDRTLHWLPQLALESAERMAETGEEPIPTTLARILRQAARSESAC